MHRFFPSLYRICGDKITILDKDNLQHIRKVLRLKAGEEIVVCDAAGNEYLAVIEKILAESIIAGIKSKQAPDLSRKKIKLTIACAIPKKSKMDDIIDKLVQLGVDRIVPLETERVIIRLDANKKVSRHKRWQKISLNSSQQSQRCDIAVIDEIRDVKDVILNADRYDLKIIPTLAGERKKLKEVFRAPAKNILVLIGPEGDFTDEEVALAESRGFIAVSLGDLVLRVDTAAVAVASFIRLYDEHN